MAQHAQNVRPVPRSNCYHFMRSILMIQWCSTVFSFTAQKYTRISRRKGHFVQTYRSWTATRFHSISTTATTLDNSTFEDVIPFTSGVDSANKFHDRLSVFNRKREAITLNIQKLKSNKEMQGNDSSIFQNGIPSYRTMLLFISTTILIWLSEPLLSLVDTTVVGQYANVIQLAALGPATMLMDSAIYLTYFLAIATTNTVATGLANREYRQLQQSTSQVLGFATLLGAIITMSMFFAGIPLLKWAAGGAATASPELIHSALTYCRIRSLVAPLTILGMVAQSVCLACLDTRTPAVAVLIASIINVIGDLLLVPHFGMGGAAAATAIASACSSLVLLRQVKSRMQAWKDKESQTNTARETKSFIGDAYISQMINGIPIVGYTDPLDKPSIPLCQLPDPKELLSLLRRTGPIFFCLVGKIICYSALSLRATNFGVIPLAAHNIWIRVFFLFATLGDSLSQASQTFLPRVLTVTQPKRILMRRLAVLGTAIGILSQIGSKFAVTQWSSYFTQDAAVISCLTQSTTVAWAGWALFLHPFIMLLEGCILASRDLTFLLVSYGITIACHFASLHWNATSFPGVWRSLFFFQTFRLIQFCWRVRSRLFWKESVSSISETVDHGNVKELNTEDENVTISS
jgi:Na+-driven multidrug efflux pump